MRTRYFGVGASAILLLWATAATAEVVTLSPPTGLNEILELFPNDTYTVTAGITDYNNGNAESGNMQRSLLLFDLSEIPADKAIISADLAMIKHASAYGWQSAGTQSQIYRVTSDWSNSSASWINASVDTPWTTVGGDYVGVSGGSTPYATNSDVIPAGTDATLHFNVTTLLSEWVSGAHPNQGMLLLGTPGNALAALELGSLSVTVLPEPSTLALLCVAAASGLVVRYGWRRRR